MEPFVIPVAPELYLRPRVLRDAKGGHRFFAPIERDIPRAVYLSLLGFPSDGAELEARYLDRGDCPVERAGVPRGHIFMDGESGKLVRVVTAMRFPDESHYDGLAWLLGVYAAFARNMGEGDPRRWGSMLVGEVLSEFWKDGESVLRRLLTPRPAR